jgi:alkylation response protein AidB-like acyl-CoA dehydrogenase
MDLRYPPEAEAFRAELRAWLDANLEPDLPSASEVLEPGSPSLERLRAWNRKLADAGYAAMSWPVEYGGRGAGLLEQLVFVEEMDRAQAPTTVNLIGMPNIAPAIMQWGTDEQKARFLPRMMRGDDIWCQGMSEPDAGSDLASLSTRAVLDGDTFVVDGQKTWNTLGHIAGWCQLYVRTDPAAPKHKGISCLLVDMSTPGIEVRPLRTITGELGFSELFFTDVRVPATALLGPLHEGWKVATTTLAFERAGVAKLHLQLRRNIAELIDVSRRTTLPDGRTASEDPVLRQRLARIYLEGEYLKLLSDRAVSGQLHGRPTGPEGSLAKLVWSDLSNHLAEVASEVLGADGLLGARGVQRVSVRQSSIAGGTTQVNRNIIAQRILGLPRGA